MKKIVLVLSLLAFYSLTFSQVKKVDIIDKETESQQTSKKSFTPKSPKATVIWEDDFETDKGWTLTGEWERDIPQGLGGSYGNPDPSGAYQGSYVLGVDLTGLGAHSGDYENSLSDREYSATSPVIDLSNYTNVHINFYRWLNVEENSYDHAYIDVYDGSNWQNVWANGSSTITDNSWTNYDIDVSAYADGNPNFRVRFCLGATDGSWQFSGWNLDVFQVTGDLAGYNTITAGSTSEPATIPSTTDTYGEAFVNFDFTVTDDGSNPGADTKNTLFNTLTIFQGSGNDVTDWTQAIAGAELSDGTNTISGTIGSTSITFSSIPDASSSDLGYIADNGSKTYTLKIWLRSTMGGTLSQNIDGDNLVFEVTTSSFGLESSSSGFASGESENSGSTNNEITVTASEFRFVQQPSNTATSGVALSQQPILWATDENGNLDQDYSGTLTLSNTGTLTMSNNSATISSGVASFSNFMFTSGGEYVRLNGSDGSISTNIPSVEIAVDIIGCALFSEDFEAYSVTSDLPSNPAGWVYTEDITSVNDWGISNGSGSNGNCLTIYRGSNDFSYDNSDDAQTIAYYTTPIDARGYRNLTLDMSWMCEGESGYDFGMIMWSTDGTNWSIANETVFQGQSSWTNGTYDLSVCDGQQFYLGFIWVNDGSVGTNPPFSIDDIVVRGLPDFDYNFTYRYDNFEQITGTIVTPDANDGVDISLPSGFNFTYDGNPVTVVRANVNGWLEMGNSHSSNAEINNLSDVTQVPLVAPLWDDLVADGQTKIIYRVDGDAPTRVFTVEWRDVLWGGQRQNFQVKLYETSSTIEFWYGAMHNPSSGSASIGINSSGCGSYNRLISITPATTPIESYTAENRSINSVDYLPEGMVYIFNPLSMQEYYSWEDATIVIGQSDFYTTSNTVDQQTAAGANSSAISSKGVLAVGSYYANRVLIWNTLPETNGVPADVVVGQPNFTSSGSGCSATELNGPYNVAFSPDGQKLLIADAENNRVLVYNSIPTTNGAAADVVIGQPDFTSNSSGCSEKDLYGPTGILVLPDGRLLITDDGNNRVLIFDSIPTTNYASASVVIGQPDFTSNSAGSGADQLDAPWDCAFSPEGKLLISDDGDPNTGGNHRVLVFNDVPTTNGAAADVVIGNTTFASKMPGTSKNEFNQPSITCSLEGKLAIADFGNSRVMMYKRIPAYNGADADRVLGQPNFETDVYFNDGYDNNGGADQRNQFYPYSINFDLNGRLYVNGTHGSGSGMHRVMVYGETPTTTADLEVSIVPDQTTVCIYNDVEYTVELINHGPDDAYNVTVNAQVPYGMVPKDYSAQNGSTYNQKSGYWKVPFIANGDTARLVFSGTVQPALGGHSNVVAYANTLGSSQKDNDYSNNGDNAVVAVRAYYAPQISEIDDQYMPRNSSLTINFTVSDGDGLSDITSYTATSSNTTLVPVDYTNNIIFGGTAPNKTVQIIPTADEYGYSQMSVIVTDSHGCYNEEPFMLTVGNFWEGDDVVISPTKWDVAENWSYDVPSPTLEAIIPTKPKGGFFPIIDVSGAECEDLFIEPKASVTINDTYGLHVYGKTYLKSDATGTAAFVDLSDPSHVTFNDTIFVERYMTSDAWHYLSASMEETPNTALTTDNCNGNYNGNIIVYNEAYNSDMDGDGDTDWMDGWEWPYYYDHNVYNLDVGKGYGYYSFDVCDRTVVFKGTKTSFNTGDITVTVTNQDDTYMGVDDGYSSTTMPHRGWNFLGNPYPCGLNADDFLNENSSVIDGTVYFWDEPGDSGFDVEGGDYASYNPTLGASLGSGSGSVLPDKYISIGQAFYVHKTSSSPVSGTVTFKNSMKETENSYFFSPQPQNEVQRIKLAMTDNQGLYNEIIIGLLDDATDGFDPKYDAYKLEGNPNIAFYSIADSIRLVMQAVPTIQKPERKDIALGFKTGDEGEFVITKKIAEYLPDDMYVTLEDTYTSQTVNILKQDYSFYVDEAGRYDDRFILHIYYDTKPEVANQIENMTATEDLVNTFVIPENAFYDADENDDLTLTLQLDGQDLPTWMRFNSENNTLTAVPKNENVGTYKLKVIATDNAGLSADQIVNLTVENVNDDPFVVDSIADYVIDAGLQLTIDVAGTFEDVDAGDNLHYYAMMADDSNLPTWINFDENKMIFTITPAESDAGVYTIRLVAEDNAGSTANCDFTITVKSSTANSSIANNDVRIYPSPSDGKFSICAPFDSYKYAVVSENGKVILSKKSHSKTVNVDLKGISAGVYTVQIYHENKVVEKRLVIK